MKHATKLMVVPYVKPLENPVESKVLELDNEMSSIINDSKLNFDDKVKLYNQTLAKFISNYDPNSFGISNVMSNMASQVSELAQNIEPEIKKELNAIKGQLIDIKNKNIINKNVGKLKRKSVQVRISPNNVKTEEPIDSKIQNLISEDEDQSFSDVNNTLNNATMDAPSPVKPSPNLKTQLLKPKNIESGTLASDIAKQALSNEDQQRKSTRTKTPTNLFQYHKDIAGKKQLGKGIWLTKNFFN